MENAVIGLEVRKRSDQHLCTYSVAEKLYIIAGDMVYLDKNCKYIVKSRETSKSIGIEAVVEAASFCGRLSKLNAEYKRRVSFDLFNSSRRPIDVRPYREPALSLHEARLKYFKNGTANREDIYMFVLGMCGLGLHVERKIGVIDSQRAAIALEFWWEELCNASRVCGRLLTKLNNVSHKFELLHRNLLDHHQYFTSCISRYEARINQQSLINSGKLVMFPFVEQCQRRGGL